MSPKRIENWRSLIDVQWECSRSIESVYLENGPRGGVRCIGTWANGVELERARRGLVELVEDW